MRYIYILTVNDKIVAACGTLRKAHRQANIMRLPIHRTFATFKRFFYRDGFYEIVSHGDKKLKGEINSYMIV